MWRIWGLSLEGQSPYSWEAALIPRIDRLYRIWGLSPRGQTQILILIPKRTSLIKIYSPIKRGPLI